MSVCTFSAWLLIVFQDSFYDFCICTNMYYFTTNLSFVLCTLGNKNSIIFFIYQLSPSNLKLSLVPCFFLCLSSRAIAAGPWGPVWPDPSDVLCPGWPPGLCRDSAEGWSLSQQDGPKPTERSTPRCTESRAGYKSPEVLKKHISCFISCVFIFITKYFLIIFCFKIGCIIKRWWELNFDDKKYFFIRTSSV